MIGKTNNNANWIETVMKMSIYGIKLSFSQLLRYIRKIAMGKKETFRSTAISDRIIKEYNKTRKYVYSKQICQAPFKSLYFSPEGKVYACCYNRSYILGSYPEQPINIIWQAKPIQVLREALRANDLTMGCFPCLTQLEEGTYRSVLSRYFDDYPKRKYPSVMEFELSNVCNMACVMCDGRYSSIIRKEREKLSPISNPYNAEFVQQLEEFIPHLNKAKFLGGEPFLIHIYYDIWDKIMEINPKCVISVQTNGSVLNDRIKKLMESGNFHITVSVDAISRKVFDTIRLKGDFDKVMDNIQFFRSYSKRRNAWFGVTTCPMQQNWQEIPDIINYCNEMDAEIIFNRVWHPPQCALWNCRSDRLEDVFKIYSTVVLPDKTPVQCRNKQQFSELTNQIRQWASEQKRRETQQTEFAGLDNKALEKELQKKIDSYLEKVFSENEMESGSQIVQHKMVRILAQFSEHPNYRKMLFKLHEFHAGALYSEFRKNSVEALFRQAEAYLSDL
jgi:MoaA/NifB/PqqE/SkfB family radical SAM enzyme